MIFRTLFIVYLFTITFISNAYSQNKWKQANAEFQSYLKNFSEFNYDSLTQKSFKSIEKIGGLFKANSLKCKRNRDFGIIETIYSIEIEYLTEKSYYSSIEYDVHIFSKKNTIFGIASNQVGTRRNNQTSYFNNVELELLLKKHNQFYESEITKDDFTQNILTLHVYGHHCGEEGTENPSYFYGGISYKKSKNKKLFQNWLKSFNLELQTYGVEGLEYLNEHKGLKLSDSEKDMIAHIKERNSLLNSCGGCLYGFYEKAF
jgi:hypothetical protein